MKFLMSPPGPGWRLHGRANFKSAEAAQVDATAARREWDMLVATIERAGGSVHVLPDNDALTGLPFAAEAGLPLPDKRFLLPHMKPAHRRGEAQVWAPFVEALGYSVLPAPREVFEGQGDVAYFAGRALVFYGGRSTRAGAEHAAQLLGERALLLEIREPAFHGNVALLPLVQANRLMFCPDVFSASSLALLDATFASERFVRITLDELRAYTTNTLAVGNTLIATHLLPTRLAALMRKFGYQVEQLPLVELCEKGGGAARCLVCEL